MIRILLQLIPKFLFFASSKPGACYVVTRVLSMQSQPLTISITKGSKHKNFLAFKFTCCSNQASSAALRIPAIA